MKTEEILTAASQRVCPTCGGNIWLTSVDPNGDPFSEQCPECGNSGLWLPMLSIKCEWSGHRVCATSSADETCDGSGRIPNFTRDSLDEAAEKLGITFSISEKRPSEFWYWFGIWKGNVGGYDGLGATRLESQQAAFAAVVRAVWPEVVAHE